MIKFLLMYLMLLSLVSAETVQVAVGKSISEMMVKVRSGDTIMLSSGVYKENIVLRDKVILKGKGVDSTTIKGDGRGSVVTMNGNSTIEDLTVLGGQNGIQVQSGTAKITSVVVVENRGSGILALRALPEIRATIVARNGGNGIQASTIGGGSLILDSLTFAENGGFGFEYDGTVPVSLKSCLFYNNGIKAIKDSDRQVIASSNCIVPEQKEYSSSNITGKLLFQSEKKAKKLYIQDKTSPGFGMGAIVR